MRSPSPGLWTMSTRWKEGQSTAASATSPQLPQPTQLSSMAATGSSRKGSSSDLTESEGQPESRMQA